MIAPHQQLFKVPLHIYEALINADGEPSATNTYLLEEGSSVLNLAARRGGSEGNWTTPGDAVGNNYTNIGSTMTQLLVVNIHLDISEGDGSLAVTLPIAYDSSPIVIPSFLNIIGTPPNSEMAQLRVSSTTTTATLFVQRTDDSVARDYIIACLVIGPRPA